MMGIRAKSVFGKYPMTFSFLVLVAVIFVLHGFDELIKETPFLNTHPSVLLLIGLIILVLTGTLYKRLDKRLD